RARRAWSPASSPPACTPARRPRSRSTASSGSPRSSWARLGDVRELDEDRLLVTGEARREVAADRAVWTLLVTEEGDSAAETFARCGGRLDALTAALRGAFDAGDVRTGALGVRP